MYVAVDAQTTSTTTKSVNNACPGISAHSEQSTHVDSDQDTLQATCQTNKVTNTTQANNSIQASIQSTQSFKQTMIF
jgi:hypothetical protein